MISIKRFDQFLLEKTIGIENIRNKWYSDIDKTIFYKIINIDPTSVRKKEFSKPGKYAKWLLREYKKGNLTLNDLDNSEFRDKINYYLFIFSTGWFKSIQKKKNRFVYYQEIDNIDILKYDLKQFLNVLHGYVENFKIVTDNAKFDIVYYDNLIDIMIPINFTASYEIAKKTQWCSQSIVGFSYWKDTSILFRIIPKDNPNNKLKLTWRKQKYDGNWFMACSKYPEIIGKDSPFKIINGKENWFLKKLELDKNYYLNKNWVENSKIIEKTMNLLSEESKNKIEEYYYAFSK